MDPISNFSTYRGTLEKAIGQADAAKDGPHGWVVPFFSLIVKDIYFMHEGMSDRDIKGFIRFEKCMSLARLVSQILGYKERLVSGIEVLHGVGGAWFIRRGKSVATVEWEGLLWYALPAVDSIIFVLGQQLPFPRIRNVLNYLMTIPVHTDDGESGQVLADSYTSSQN